jgi:hypothetical protein
MDTSKLKKFATKTRADLLDQVTARLEYVLTSDTPELRAQEKILKELKKQIAATSKEAVIERVAYTWFNRFCALRFMDVNRYTPHWGIVSPAEGQHPARDVLRRPSKAILTTVSWMNQKHAKRRFLILLSGARASGVTRRQRLIVCCWWPHVTTMPQCHALICLSALKITPSCCCPTICSLLRRF